MHGLEFFFWFCKLMGLAAPVFKCFTSVMCNEVAGCGAKFCLHKMLL